MNIRLRLPAMVILLSGLALWTVSGCKSSGKKDSGMQELRIFHAGSLSVPVKEIAAAYMQEHPDVKILTEAAGSIQCIRKITDLNQLCDVLAVADYSLIDEMMIPEHATWNIRFASNELCIAWMERPDRPATINSDSWFNELLKPEVRYGRSNPDSDPCGYRTILALKLAGRYYPGGVPWQELLAKDNRFIRSKETDLNALLESGSVDYIFTYLSVAEQHGFDYLRLPDSVNLGRPELDGWYSSVSTDIPGKRPGSRVEKRGAAISYGITVPKNVTDPEPGRDFVRYLLDPDKGGQIFSRCAQPLTTLEYSSAGGTEDLLPESRDAERKKPAGR